jgi:RHS repeat-associated protein
LTSSLSAFNFEYTHKPYDSTTGLYYYGARFYDPTIARYITEDTTKGSLENPVTLNRYAYANDNPLAVIDPTGNSGWWTSFTSAVSSIGSGISSGASTLASDIVGAATNPETQTILATAAVDVGTGAAIVATGGAILATPAGGALLGAAVSATSYTATTILTGGHGNLESWAIATGTGALIGAATEGLGEYLGGTAEESSLIVREYNPLRSLSPEEALSRDFPYGLKVTDLNEPMTLNRYYGGSSQLPGQFGTPETFSSPQEAIERLGLQNTGNTAENVGQMTIMPGARVYQGLTSGGAWQVYVYYGTVLFR